MVHWVDGVGGAAVIAMVKAASIYCACCLRGCKGCRLLTGPGRNRGGGVCPENQHTLPAFPTVSRLSRFAVDPLLAKGAAMLHRIVRIWAMLICFDTLSKVAELAPFIARA